MMRRISIGFFLLCILVIHVSAQNIQIHYDLGQALYEEESERPWVTTTLEMFKPDPWGSTYFFVDMDYANEGVASAYWEIARELKFWKNPFSVHIEYNGGIKYINHSYLGGGTYTFNDQQFTKGFSLSAMYKYIQKNDKPHNFQLTATWYLHLKQKLFTFSGFFDFWREKHLDVHQKKHSFIVLSEPQFWMNLKEFPKINDNFKLSIGSELEVSNNFALRDGWYFIPTVAVKWSFD